MAYVRRDCPGSDVRSVPATLLAFLLLFLLAVTTPTGTGDGVHNSLLLHPLFAHTHLINGRIVTHQSAESASAVSTTSTQDGPAIGAEAGAAVGRGAQPDRPTPGFRHPHRTALPIDHEPPGPTNQPSRGPARKTSYVRGVTTRGALEKRTALRIRNAGFKTARTRRPGTNILVNSVRLERSEVSQP